MSQEKQGSSSAVIDGSLSASALPKILLIGHPNVGKSVLFHALTGRYAMVSNFPGTTVDMIYADAKIAGREWNVIDTPGVVALPPRTEDEAVTRDSILRYKPEVLIQVADAKDLARTLHLTLDLTEYGVPMILALNMADEARDRGIMIDTARLSDLLGFPVVETVAVNGEGIHELKTKVAEAAVSRVLPRYDRSIEELLEETAVALIPENPAFGRLAAVSLFIGDGGILAHLEGRAKPEALSEATKKVWGIRQRLARPFEMLRFEARQAVIQEILGEVWRKKEASQSDFLSKVGLWCLRPFPGYLIAFFMLYLLYEFVGVFGAQTLVGWLEETVFGAWLMPGLTALVQKIIPWPLMQDFLVGEYGIFSMAVTYALALIFPIVTTFFIFFGILEDSGYLPRLAVMLDRAFRLIGLNGKAVLPMILGLGCGTMATVTTRILSTSKEKLLVSLLLTLAVPCSAQLGAVFGMAGGISFGVLLAWFLVIVFTMMLIGWMASRVLPGGRPPLLVQIPPIRVPQFSNVMKKVTSRLVWYSQEVIPLFLFATALLFVLDKVHLLAVLRNMIAPVVVDFLGLPEKCADAFLIGFLRRDYGAAGLFHMAQQGLLNPRQVLVSMVLVTLFMPCVAHMLVTYRERGLKITAAIFIFVMSYAILTGGAINAFLQRFPLI